MSTASDALEVRLHVRHVGLGDAFLLELPDNRCAVIDWGTAEENHYQYLVDVVGDRELAFVAATHGHEDHTAGLPRLFRTFIDLDKGCSRIREYYTPLAEELHHGSLAAVSESLSELWERHPRLGPSRDVRIKEPTVVDGNTPPILVQTDTYCLMALHPPEHLRARDAVMAAYAGRKSGNRPGLVLLFRLAGGCTSILFGGDAETPTWNAVREVVQAFPEVRPNGPITIISHHGAASSHGMPAWAIQRWAQGLSILSVPSADEHHPALSTLEEVCRVSEKVYCTSYAEVCEQAFRGTGAVGGGSIISNESCFGNLVITLRGDGTYSAVHDGPGLRHVGHCHAT